MMLQKYLYLVFLSSVAYSKIIIKIQAGGKNEALVQSRGQDKAVISDEEMITFNVTQKNLKYLSKIGLEEECTSTFLKDPTPYGDVYSRYGWDEVQRIVEPIRAVILRTNTSTVLLASKKYTNNRNKPFVYKKNLIKVVKETVKHTWNGKRNLTLERSISYDVNFGAGSVGGSTILRYNSRFGEDDYQERQVTLGPTSSAAVTVPPNSTIVEYLYATKGEMVVQVNYRAEIEGQMFCNYEKKYKGHHFYAIDVNYFLGEGDLPQALYSYENIKVEFYIHAIVMTADEKTGLPVKTVGGGIVQTNE